VGPLLPVVASIDSDDPVADFNKIDYGLEIQFNDASTGAVFYKWDFGDGKTSTIADPIHKYSEEGNYEVKLGVTNGCGSDSITKSIDVIDAINDNIQDKLVRVYPNPNTGEFIIEYHGNDLYRIDIIDLRGNLEYNYVGLQLYGRVFF